ncbi:hypothetical protein F66182_6246 [Fusarium sp. NRRL 66182]|nr:hypothetical protein F66182_6246 [Fusarium sp. NRRL 66182]
MESAAANRIPLLLSGCGLDMAAAQRETRGLQGSVCEGAVSKLADTAERDDGAEGHLRPSLQCTGHQLFYLFGLDGIGAMVLSGGVNFALAYGEFGVELICYETEYLLLTVRVMYTAQDTAKNPIRLFQLPNTLSGDAAVTIIIQCILTWFVEMGLVSYDLSKRSVQPIGFIPEPSHKWLRWLFFLPSSELSESEVTSEKGHQKSDFSSALTTIVQGALRGFMFAVVSFVLLWPLSVGVLTTVGKQADGDWLYQDRWTPQAFKAILGGVLSLLTTPLMAMFWLIKAGWEGNDKRCSSREERRSQYAETERSNARASRQSRYMSPV